jgi:hypothetical protein
MTTLTDDLIRHEGFDPDGDNADVDYLREQFFPLVEEWWKKGWLNVDAIDTATLS